MKKLFSIFTSGRFWIHVCLIIIVLFAIIKLVLVWIGAYTQHGEHIVVPDLSGMKMAEVVAALENTDLNYEVTDSVYSDHVKRGVVVLQNPLPEMKVKQGRTIFLSVNSVLPEMVAMPDLLGKSRRIAVPLIEITGLEVGELAYKPDASCTDCVVGQEYDSEAIEPGTLIRKGEKITLWLGQQSNDEASVPELMGMNYAEASQAILGSSLNIGEVISCNGCETSDDTLGAFVTNQIPNHGDEVRLGSFVDMYLTTDSTTSRNFNAVNDTLVP